MHERTRQDHLSPPLLALLTPLPRAALALRKCENITPCQINVRAVTHETVNTTDACAQANTHNSRQGPHLIARGAKHQLPH